MGVQQGSALRLLLFVVVMQEATRAARSEGSSDSYVNNQVLTAESEEGLIRTFGV